MKKLFPKLVLLIFVMSLISCQEDSLAGSEDSGLEKAGTNFTAPNTFDVDGNLCININSPVEQVGKPMQLWMGVGNEKAGTLVGTVSFLHGPDRVKIDLTDSDGDGTPDMFPYVIEVAHIHFASSESGIPQTNKGNPIPGKFEYNVDIDPYISSIEIEVDFDDVGAIHLAVEKIGGIEGFNFYLPNNVVKMKVLDPSPENNSYWKLQIKEGGFISDYDFGYGPGVYEGWCFAESIPIIPNVYYDAKLYSSYENIPQEILDYSNINEENLDNANYLLNNYRTGDEVFDQSGNSLGFLGLYELQRAIWVLINGSDYSGSRINVLVNDALINGEGFVPGCDDKIIFLAVPIDPDMEPIAQLITGQPTIGQIPIPCETEGGTAWGDGYYGATFPGSKQWGTWFMYDPNCVPN